jgi:hypothetical protein
MLALTRFAAFLAVGLFVLAGPVRAADPETGTLEGHITLDGKPVAKGKIVFHPQKGKPIEADLKEEGTYQAKDVPVGAARVTIEGEGVPAKYADPKTTPLLFDVKKGTSTADLDLKK